MTSIPLRNVAPATTLGNWFSPFSLRQVFAAAITSLKTISRAVEDDSDPVPHGREDAFDGVRGSQVIPVLGREVVEGQQGLAILPQALDCPGVLRPIFLSEDVDRGLRRRAGFCAVDLAQVGLHSRLDGAGDLVQHVGSFVHPTALMASAGIDLLEGLPEPQRAVTDCDLGRDGEPASLHLDQELTPALSTLPDTNLEAHQLLRALGRRADDDQHAFGMLLHPGLQVDAVGPDVEIAARREVASLPALVLGLPLRA